MGIDLVQNTQMSDVMSQKLLYSAWPSYILGIPLIFFIKHNLRNSGASKKDKLHIMITTGLGQSKLDILQI